jgi:hypothetical protein
MANEVLTHISKDDHERAKFRSRQKFIAEEGKAEGLEEGITKGWKLRRSAC